MKIIKVLIGFFCIVVSVVAQQLHFSGAVTFERKENMHKQFADRNDNWADEIKNRMPKYRVDEFVLNFNKNKSHYKITKQEDNAYASWWRVAAGNTVVNNLTTKTTTNVKEIYDELYLIEDTMPVFKWRYHTDIRKIGGYNCRKATTIISDSLYVIAFYSDEFPVQTGPESLNGLPGLILGYVIPRLNITCFATKIETKLITDAEMEFKKPKSKPVNFFTFYKIILDATKKWGEYAGKVYFKTLI